MTTTTIDNRTVTFSDAILELQPQSLLTTLVKDFIESEETDCEMYNMEDMFKAVLIMVSEEGDIHVVHPTEVAVRTVTLDESGFINESTESPVTTNQILQLHRRQMIADAMDELIAKVQTGEVTFEDAAERLMKCQDLIKEQLG